MARIFRFSPEGVECDASGMRIGGVALIERDLVEKWSVVDAPRASQSLSLIYGFPVDISKKLSGLMTVARALDAGALAEAQVTTLLLQFPVPPGGRSFRISDRQRLCDELWASGMLKVDVELSGVGSDEHRPNETSRFSYKYNFNPDEPRDSRVRWTREGGNDDGVTPAHRIDAAYQGEFHDSVVKDEIEQYRKAGAICVSEVRLSSGEITARLDILCRGAQGNLLGAEIKTGEDPDFTLQQKSVYAHAIVGGLTSPDAKIQQLGFSPNQILPPMQIFLVYVSGPGALKRYFGPL